jgi:Zinc-binding dehydrogenase
VGHLPDGLDFEPAAPILCAGVTVYKGLKETDAKPGDTVVISGIGGLGHVAVQYAKAMGLGVIAVDIADEKLSLARKMGADAVVNAITTDAVAEVNKFCGGARGVLVTAVSPKAFSQVLGMLGKGGTMVLVGLPPGSFELDIFNIVLMRDHSGIDRGDATRSRRVPAVRRRRQGEGPLLDGTAGRHQQHLRPHARQQDRRSRGHENLGETGPRLGSGRPAGCRCWCLRLDFFRGVANWWIFLDHRGNRARSEQDAPIRAVQGVNGRKQCLVPSV